MLISNMLLQIETEDDYRDALKRFLEICAAPKDSKEERELYLLMDLMEKYERNNCSFT
ncbi:hypothetical protein [Maribellus maritimus]|uniref:hypothetical protein n=1 Tax=Maribellus maritimus TaxID=2870838 RepID=UPI001EEAB867|nr:hypothetical protein [Maribellus maritimus]